MKAIFGRKNAAGQTRILLRKIVLHIGPNSGLLTAQAPLLRAAQVQDIHPLLKYPTLLRVITEMPFLGEQFLLPAVPLLNSEFKAFSSNSYFEHHWLSELKEAFSLSPCWGGGRFWIRRKPAT